MSENFKDLINKAKEMEDQSEVQAGGGNFEYTPPAKGRTVGRFIEYIEIGKHVTMYQGKPKPAVAQVRITFEFTHPTRIKEIEVNGQKQKVAERISVTLDKKYTEKAKFYKLFKAMTYGRDGITHMAEMLGEAFIFDVTHEFADDDTKKEKPYAKLFPKATQVWGVFAPRKVDDLAGTSEDISNVIPAALSPMRIFLWDNPTQPTWDSLFIDGTVEKKDDKGNITQESKNWLQNKILSATDFVGSALEQMLGGVDNLPTTGTGSNESKQKQEDAPAEKDDTKTVHAGIEEDPLKALGF